LVVQDVLAHGLDAANLDRLDDVRAFELLVTVPGNGSRPATLQSIRWDGRSLARAVLMGPVMRVSSTLDPVGATRERAASWRRRWPTAPPENPAELHAWLASHEPDKGTWSVCMHRDDACTVSRALLEVHPRWASLDYTDGPPCEIRSPRRTYGFPVVPHPDRPRLSGFGPSA
jgi:hypothetical protein